MVLNLEQLRADYKSTYKNNWSFSCKIELLIEVTKIELKYQRQTDQAAKRIGVSQVVQEHGISVRTLQRWKKLYRDQDLSGIAPKRRGHPPRKQISIETQDLIKTMREKYRWGSEVTQAHLRYDHNTIINRYQIDRYLTESGLRELYPCTTIKKQKEKRKKHDKKVVVDNPGEHTQMDVKYQLHLLLNGEKAYVYNLY